MSDKKIELIAQLLAKAEQTTPEEAEALTEHAERLMLKYGIEQAVINDRRAKSGQSEEEIVTVTMLFKGAYRLEYLFMGVEVAGALGSIRCMKSTYKNQSATLYMVGFKSDVEQAQVLLSSLMLQSVVATRVWWKVNKGLYAADTSYDQEAARRSFVRGFSIGAGRRIAANRQQAVHEAGSGTELVLVDRAAKVNAFVDSTMKLGVDKSRGGKGSYQARNAGFQAGQNASTGEKAVSNRKAVSA